VAFFRPNSHSPGAQLAPANQPLDKETRFLYFVVQSEEDMNDLNKALGDIHSIRRQVANATEFRGYGPATLACTSVLAVVAACAQAFLLPDPATHIGSYLSIWMITALLSAGLIGTEMHARTRRIH